MAEEYCPEGHPPDYCWKCEKIEPNPKKKGKKLCCRQCEAPLRTKGVGLALSGGGYRAAIFHLGSLWRLNELGWLKELAEVTSVSGGSITAGWLGLHWKKLKFGKDGVATNFVEEVIDPIREFCSHGIEGEAVFCGLDKPYRRKLFGKATLQDLPSDEEGPRFTIYATSLQTGVSVRLAKPYLADYNLGCFEDPEVSLAKAVAASSAFPIFMAPIILRFEESGWKDWELKKPKKDEDTKTISPEDKKKMRQTMVLTDGGVYDNLGLERIWDRYSTVLVSDAGAPFSMKTGSFWGGVNRCSILLRSSGIITEQTRRLRKRWLINDLVDEKLRGTYWGIATHIGDYGLEKHKCKPPLLKDGKDTAALAELPTRLKSFRKEKQEDLINWSYALADAGMRRWLPESGTEPGRLPYPK